MFNPSHSSPCRPTTMYWWQHLNKTGTTRRSDHHFSASAIKKYEDCPLCYKFQYVLQVPSLQKTYFSMGTAVHSVIEHLSRAPAGRIPAHKRTGTRTAHSCCPHRPIPPGPMNSRTGSKPKHYWTRILLAGSQQEHHHRHGKEVPVHPQGRTVKGYSTVSNGHRTGSMWWSISRPGQNRGTLTKNSVPLDIQLNLYCLAINEMYGKLRSGHRLLHQRQQDG